MQCHGEREELLVCQSTTLGLKEENFLKKIFIPKAYLEFHLRIKRKCIFKKCPPSSQHKSAQPPTRTVGGREKMKLAAHAYFTGSQCLLAQSMAVPYMCPLPLLI